jgi:hypothetical protein
MTEPERDREPITRHPQEVQLVERDLESFTKEGLSLYMEHHLDTRKREALTEQIMRQQLFADAKR